jgi:hypothetical protein
VERESPPAVTRGSMGTVGEMVQLSIGRSTSQLLRGVAVDRSDRVPPWTGAEGR